MLKLILASVILVSLAFAGLAIKMFLLKGAEFQKSCGSLDPHSGERQGCSCGSDENSSCESS